MSGLSLALALSLAATPALQARELSPFPPGQAVLVIFGAQADPACAEQLRRLGYAERGLATRGAVALRVEADTVTLLLGASGAYSSTALRVRFGISDQAFAVVLIDRDGEIRLHRSEPVTASELFSLLDESATVPFGIAA